MTASCLSRPPVVEGRSEGNQTPPAIPKSPSTASKTARIHFGIGDAREWVPQDLNDEQGLISPHPTQCFRAILPATLGATKSTPGGFVPPERFF